jgi:MFS family permease
MIHIRTLKGKIAWRKTSPSILLVFNSFVWYIFTYAVFSTIVNGLNLPYSEKLGLFTIYYVGVAVSAILGAKFLSSVRTRSLDLWPFMGAIATLLLTTISSNSMLASASLVLFLGASIGIGLPSCLSYFADSTSVENRGFVSGITWGTVGFTVLVFAFLINPLGQWEVLVALTIWRLFGGIGFLVLNRKHEKPNVQKSPSYLEIIRKRAVLLYLFPWIMFSIINFLEAPILEVVFGAEFAFVQIVEYAIAGVVAVVGGVIADIAGRKRVVITGFVMLGVEYAAMSTFSSSPATMYLFLALDGVTWGLFLSVFLTVIWGDLGENSQKEKYYVFGGLPFLLAGILSILIEPYASSIPVVTVFSFASFFLFVAVIPLMYAPETLPEKIIKDRELKSYLEKAQEVKEKYS